VADLGDSGEVLRYLVGFWAFLFSPEYRAEVLHRWREAAGGTRILMGIEGVVTTTVGVGLPLLLAWLLGQCA
jgi:hypothetical protein